MFVIVNLISQFYSFEWICEDEDDVKKLLVFKCFLFKGSVRCGKKFQVIVCDFFFILEFKYVMILVFFRRFNVLFVFQVLFEFIFQEFILVEFFWRFYIFEQNISVSFLLVGQVRESDIFMDRFYMNFKVFFIGKFEINMESVKQSYVLDVIYEEGLYW